MTDYKFIQKLDDSRKEVFSRKRKCLFPDCNDIAINSHVFQKRKILDQISKPDNHFYSLNFPSVFLINKNPIIKLRKVGIIDGYSFPGFCNLHDNKIFAPIEKDSINLFSSIVQALFTYRTLCSELRKKEIAKDLNVEIAKIIYTEKREGWLFDYGRMGFQISDYRLSIKDLNFFKANLEDEIFSSNKSQFNYTTLQFPRLDVCISTPLTIIDKYNENTNDIDEFGYDKETPITTSILNFFPFDDYSYLITANHKKYFCNWTTELIKKLKNDNSR
ncbi:hypothetical protein ES708_31054 [subsurface metagenome]